MGRHEEDEDLLISLPIDPYGDVRWVAAASGTEMPHQTAGCVVVFSRCVGVSGVIQEFGGFLKKRTGQTPRNSATTVGGIRD
jgi:hypothetical protein